MVGEREREREGDKCAEVEGKAMRKWLWGGGDSCCSPTVTRLRSRPRIDKRPPLPLFPAALILR